MQATNKLSAEHRAKLRTSALTDEQIDRLGWYAAPDGSLVIPYIRPDGSPEVRHDGKPFLRRRLSDAQIAELKRKGEEKPGRYRSPKGNGCRIYHSVLATEGYQQRLKDRYRPLRITEGELKTEAATVHDPARVTIGLGGVSSWQDRYDGGEQSQPLVDFDEIPLDGREVRLCFDSDLRKPMVWAQLKGLSEFLLSKGANVLIEVLPHDLGGTVENPVRLGIDDLIYRHGAEAFLLIADKARSPFKVRRVDGADVKVWAFDPEPIESHHKAVMAWAALKDDYAMRPGFSLYSWSGTHWQADECRGVDALNAPLHGWMDRMGWNRRGSSVFGSVRSEVAARLEREGWDPPHLMAFSNGTFDTRTDTFTAEHRRGDQITFAFDFPYDPFAQCPRWHQFLDEVLGDGEMANLLRAAIRWSLMPKDRDRPYRHELAFDVHGRRGGGKGTLSEVLHALCGGSRGVGRIDSLGFQNPNALFALIGKRVAIDADASGRVSDPGTFNKIASNEPVAVKKLYADVTSARLGVVLWRFYNDQPGASGGGLEGMGRRTVTFKFDRPIVNPDRELKNKLIAEVPGIFHWAWSLGDEAMHDTLSNVGSIGAVRNAAIDAALERQPILRFLVETYPDGIESTRAQQAYEAWKQWCEAVGHKSGSQTMFGREIKKVSAVIPSRDDRGTAYQITPMKEFDLAVHLGLPSAPADPEDNDGTTDGFLTGLAKKPPSGPNPSGDSGDPAATGGSARSAEPQTRQENSQPVSDPSGNPSWSNASHGAGFREALTGLTGFPSSFRTSEKTGPDEAVKTRKEKDGQKPIKPVKPVRGAAGGTPVLVDGQPGWRLPGAMPKGNGPTVPVLLVSPAGASCCVERRRIQLPSDAAA